MTVSEILMNIKDSYCAILGAKLTGLYLHGSLTLGCFRWEVSDIDFLVIVKESLTQKEKEQLIAVLLALDPYAPLKGLEMSVMLEAVCNPFVYPTPFLLHFSNAHKTRCRENLSEYCRTMNGTDKDLAAHCVVTRHCGQVLWGQPIEVVFGQVSKADYLDSIRYDIQNARDEITDLPVYYILNLCRVLAYLGDDLVLSKTQGGYWGICHCPDNRDLIEKALAAYEKGALFHEANSRLVSFAQKMLKEIETYYGESPC